MMNVIVCWSLSPGLYYYDMVAMNCEPEYSNSEMTTSVLVIFYLFPTVLIVVCYFRLYRAAQAHRQYLQHNGFECVREHYSLFRSVFLSVRCALVCVCLGGKSGRSEVTEEGEGKNSLILYLQAATDC